MIEIVQQATDEARVCPMCPLWGIEPEEYELIGPDFFGGQAEIKGVRCCGWCATALEQLSEEDQAELLALMCEDGEVKEVVYPSEED